MFIVIKFSLEMLHIKCIYMYIADVSFCLLMGFKNKHAIGPTNKTEECIRRDFAICEKAWRLTYNLIKAFSMLLPFVYRCLEASCILCVFVHKCFDDDIWWELKCVSFSRSLCLPHNTSPPSYMLYRWENDGGLSRETESLPLPYISLYEHVHVLVDCVLCYSWTLKKERLEMCDCVPVFLWQNHFEVCLTSNVGRDRFIIGYNYTYFYCIYIHSFIYCSYIYENRCLILLLSVLNCILNCVQGHTHPHRHSNKEQNICQINKKRKMTFFRSLPLFIFLCFNAISIPQWWLFCTFVEMMHKVQSAHSSWESIRKRWAVDIFIVAS